VNELKDTKSASMDFLGVIPNIEALKLEKESVDGLLEI
jgi:hypothetical protein